MDLTDNCLVNPTRTEHLTRQAMVADVLSSKPTQTRIIPNGSPFTKAQSLEKNKFGIRDSIVEDGTRFTKLDPSQDHAAPNAAGGSRIAKKSKRKPKNNAVQDRRRANIHLLEEMLSDHIRALTGVGRLMFKNILSDQCSDLPGWCWKRSPDAKLKSWPPQTHFWGWTNDEVEYCLEDMKSKSVKLVRRADLAKSESEDVPNEMSVADVPDRSAKRTKLTVEKHVQGTISLSNSASDTEVRAHKMRPVSSARSFKDYPMNPNDHSDSIVTSRYDSSSFDILIRDLNKRRDEWRELTEELRLSKIEIDRKDSTIRTQEDTIVRLKAQSTESLGENPSDGPSKQDYYILKGQHRATVVDWENSKTAYTSLLASFNDQNRKLKELEAENTTLKSENTEANRQTARCEAEILSSHTTRKHRPVETSHDKDRCIFLEKQLRAVELAEKMCKFENESLRNDHVRVVDELQELGTLRMESRSQKVELARLRAELIALKANLAKSSKLITPKTTSHSSESTSSIIERPSLLDRTGHTTYSGHTSPYLASSTHHTQQFKLEPRPNSSLELKYPTLAQQSTRTSGIMNAFTSSPKVLGKRSRETITLAVVMKPSVIVKLEDVEDESLYD